MNGGTQAIIGTVLLLLGGGVIGLGFLEDEQQVRQVWDVVGDPSGHMAGQYVLIGVPQPPQLRTYERMEPNPAYQNETRNVEAWSHEGIRYHTTHILRVEQDATGSTWSYTNRTQEPGRPDTAIQTHATWRLDGPHTVFLIQGFPDEAGTTPWIWGVYDGNLREAVQPKPSQFRGHITGQLGPTMLPDGALVYRITEFTAGCSSKFLPEDHDAV